MYRAVELCFDARWAEGYKSWSQKARVLTQAWGKRELYCLNCSSDRLAPLRENAPVDDYLCPACQNRFQLKSQSKRFGARFANSAYRQKMEALKAGRLPSYLFLHYDRDALCVKNLFAVPSHFISISVIEKRRPLRPNARRAGWVGSTLLLDRLPADSKVWLVQDGTVRPAKGVRQAWERFRFLRRFGLERRGWLTDVLGVVRQLDSRRFSLPDVYGFENPLAQLHPRNRHVRDKIRQQLQILRDHGILRFAARGRYELVG